MIPISTSLRTPALARPATSAFVEYALTPLGGTLFEPIAASCA
jgi:hypothetical protein